MGGFSVVVLMSIFAYIFFLFLALILAIILYTFISYIFESMAIMGMSKKKKLLAWIPFYNKYILGVITGKKIIGGILGILNLISICLIIYFYTYHKFQIILFIILVIILFISYIFDMIIVHQIYKKCMNKYGNILTIFSVISFGLLRPVFLLVLRNKTNI